MELTRFEKARIIGARALQIAQGAPFLIEMKEKDLEKVGYNPVAIAKMEFEQDLIPMTIRRPMPVERVEE